MGCGGVMRRLGLPKQPRHHTRDTESRCQQPGTTLADRAGYLQRKTPATARQQGREPTSSACRFASSCRAAVQIRNRNAMILGATTTRQ